MWTPASLPSLRPNARRLPRDDQTGETSFRPNVTGEGDFRARSVTQMLLPPEAPSRLTATNEPSGEICWVLPEASTGSESIGLPDLSNQVNWPASDSRPAWYARTPAGETPTVASIAGPPPTLPTSLTTSTG